jgi:hypothetical protein
VIDIDPELEAVARGDVPTQYAHVVGASLSPDGRFAIVALTTNEGAAVELDMTVAARVDGRWQQNSSGSPSDIVYVEDHRAAVLCDGPLPGGFDRVVVRDRGQEHEVAVENGYFLYAAWQQDAPETTTDPPMPELVDPAL